MALVDTEESAVMEADNEELWDATLIPEVDPEPEVPPCDVDEAVVLKSLPVDVGLIMHVDVCEAPADRLDIELHAVTTENHEGLLESSVTMLVSVELPAVFATVTVTVACSFSVSDLDTSTLTVNAAETILTEYKNDNNIDKTRIFGFMSPPRIHLVFRAALSLNCLPP